MKILLDTYYLIWSFNNSYKLLQSVADLLVSEESEVFFSIMWVNMKESA